MDICSSAIMSQRGAGVCYWCGNIISGEEEKKITTLVWFLTEKGKNYSFEKISGTIFLIVTRFKE